jgi:tetratricopeptide (TPR) repeat protein
MPKAKQAAKTAILLDDLLAEAHSSLGCIEALYNRDWAASEREFKRAIELNPNSTSAHYWYAIWCLLPKGQFDDCLVEIRKAQALDPLSVVLNTGIGWRYYFAREYDQAIIALQQVLNLEPDFMIARDILGQSYEQHGMLAEAIVEIEKAVELSNRQSLSLCSLGHAFAVAGRLKEAKGILAELKKLAKKAPVSAYHKALVYTGLGDSEKALASLEKAYDDHNGWLNFLKVEPRFNGLRSNARFNDLVQKVGLQG